MTKLPEEVRSLLNERRFAVLATINSDGTPQQTAMWYELRGDAIMMNTRVGRIKEINLRARYRPVVMCGGRLPVRRHSGPRRT